MNAWIALLSDAGSAGSPDLATSCDDDVLVAWRDADHRPHPLARRVDAAILDASGPPAIASLLWLARDALPLFDDPAVGHARRRAISLPRARAVSTFTVDSSHFAGSIWVPGAGRRLDDDPFRALGRARTVHIGAGLLGHGPALVGPAQERYSGAPWPSGAFAR